MKIFAGALIAAGALLAVPAQANEELAKKVKKGGQGVWGPVPMPPNAAVPDADIKTLVDWILKMS
jgi:cytochrome c551/c552